MNKRLLGMFFFAVATYIALGYGYTYAMTIERFPVEGLIGASVPLLCVLLSVLATVLVSDE